MYRMGDSIQEKRSEKDLEVIVDKELNKISQCNDMKNRANVILACINRGVMRR